MIKTDDVVSFITMTLKGIFRDNYSDVPKVQLYYHFTESVLISLLNAQRLRLVDMDRSMVLSQMVELGLLSSDILVFYNAHREIIEGSMPFEAATEWNNVHSIHEGLFRRELNISEKEIWFLVDKVSRDNTGSYYTPGNLALEVVSEAIEKYLKANDVNREEDAVRLLAETKFADLSCGCGEFIKAVCSELLKRYHIKLEKISLNLYGIDIDPIALQITVCDFIGNYTAR